MPGGPGDDGGSERRPERSQRVEINAAGASDTEQRRRANVAKTVYGRDELDKYGDNTMSDVLKRLPGINVQGGSVRMRGLGGGYTQLLVNGEPAPPGFSMDNLSPSQVERIEVTKGATADTSAQAVAGTVNVILKEPPRQRQRELRLSLGYSADHATPGLNATFGDRVGKLSVVLPLSGFMWRNRSDTVIDRQTLDAQQQPQHLLQTGRDTYWGGGVNFSPRFVWRFDEVDSLNWQSFVQRGEFNGQSRYLTEVQAGSTPVSVDDLGLNQGYWQNLRSSLQWQRKLEDGQRVELRAGVQGSENRSRTLFDGRDAAGQTTLTRDTVNNNHESGWTTNGKVSLPLFESQTLSTGFDGEWREREEVRSVSENGQPQLPGYDGQPYKARITRAALFAQDEWEWDRQWSANLGLRAERIETLSQDDTGASQAEVRNNTQVVTPLLHVNYRLAPGGRDLVRASWTRSFRAPPLNQLLARPTLNPLYPPDVPNPQISPDRIGNPQLEPELASGIDVSFEKYLAGGGLVSVGLFHRRLTGVIRNQVTLEDVPWAGVPRWVSRPVNLSAATTTGLELEMKGRAGELLPALFTPQTALNLRAALNVYRSSVEGIPGPDNRLESQPPWSGNLGADYQVRGLPFALGASLAYTPAYAVQQAVDQRQSLGERRTFDAYAQWSFSPQAVLRLGASNIAPPAVQTATEVSSDDGHVERNVSTRRNRAFVNLGLTLKF